MLGCGVRHDMDVSGLGPIFEEFSISLNAQRRNILPHESLGGRSSSSILFLPALLSQCLLSPRCAFSRLGVRTTTHWGAPPTRGAPRLSDCLLSPWARAGRSPPGRARGAPHHSTMQLEPTDALLRICPLQVIANIYGCVARRELKQQRINVETESIVNIAPNDASSLQHIHTQAGAWSQSLLGNTKFARQLGYNHSRIINERYALTARYLRGFLISPVTPWRNTKMLAARVSSVLDLAQTYITIALLSLDTTADGTYESTVPSTPTSGVPADRRLLSHHHPHISRATGPRMRHVSRMMLQLNAPPPAPDTTREITATTQEITSIRDDSNVARAMCIAASTKVCQMRINSQQLTAGMYCLAETDLVDALRQVVIAQLKQASHGVLAAIRITSIHHPQFEVHCRPLPSASSDDGSARRLLQQNAGKQHTHLRVVEIYAAVTSLEMFIDL